MCVAFSLFICFCVVESFSFIVSWELLHAGMVLTCPALCSVVVFCCVLL